MSLKIKALATLTTLASYFNVAFANETTPDSASTPIEKTTSLPQSPSGRPKELSEYSEYSESDEKDPQFHPTGPKPLNTSPDEQNDAPVWEQVSKIDTLAILPLSVDSLSTYSVITNDSTILAQRRANLENAKELMMYVVAHFEGMRSRAYYDKIGKKWTICLGNTVRPDGKPVRSTDVIHSEAEALGYFNAHVDAYMTEDMITYLPLERMNTEEIAIIGSLFYNCGSGILRNKNKEQSSFSINASNYFLTHDDNFAQKFDIQYADFCHAQGKVNRSLLERRQHELLFLHNDIKITITEPSNSQNNIINLREAVLGTFVGCAGNSNKILSRFEDQSVYRCEGDSLKTAIQNQLTRQATTYVKKAPQKKQPAQPQKTINRSRTNSRSRSSK